MIKKRVKHIVKHRTKPIVEYKTKHKDINEHPNEVTTKPEFKEAQKIKEAHEIFSNIRKESHKAIVGQDNIINGILRSILSDGHSIVEGVPGIAKTLIVKTIAQITGCTFSRIQFTADLLPTDITGLTIYNKEKEEFTVIKGPVFANFIIADEINRSPPKVQSALLEAMQEEQVTIGKTTHSLPLPFFVMATQNALEQSGVYALP